MVSNISETEIIQMNIATSFVILQSTEPSQSPEGLAFHVIRREIQEAHRPLVTWSMKTKFVDNQNIYRGIDRLILKITHEVFLLQ
jgi:hypothetical protein